MLQTAAVQSSDLLLSSLLIRLNQLFDSFSCTLDHLHRLMTCLLAVLLTTLWGGCTKGIGFIRNPTSVIANACLHRPLQTQPVDP